MSLIELEKQSQLDQSYWIASTEDTNYPALNKNITVDIAIVGAGIVGIATAYQLLNSGMSIALFDGDRIAQATTGHTTAKVTSQHGLIYAQLISRFGRELAQQYATANEFVIKELKTIADQNNIDCDYTSLPAFVFTQDQNYVQQIKDEVEAAKSLGISASFVEQIPFSMQIKAGIRFDNQAQFHPRKFLLPIADFVHKEGGQIYEQSKIVKMVQKPDGKYLLNTSEGYAVTANRVIIATNNPFYDEQNKFTSRISQLKTYAVLIKAQEKFPDGVFINAEQPNRSMRAINNGSEELILVVGDSQNVDNNSDASIHYQALIDFAKGLFTVEDVVFSWYTQDSMTADGLPYVGQFAPETPNLYIATGFGKWGVTNGIVASSLLRSLIVNNFSPWETVYNPSR